MTPLDAERLHKVADRLAALGCDGDELLEAEAAKIRGAKA